MTDGIMIATGLMAVDGLAVSVRSLLFGTHLLPQLTILARFCAPAMDGSGLSAARISLRVSQLPSRSASEG